MGVHLPEPRERRPEAQRDLHLPTSRRPAQGCAQVVVLALEPIEPSGLVDSEQVVVRGVSEVQEVLRMPI